jgi:hypothetical protein
MANSDSKVSESTAPMKKKAQEGRSPSFPFVDLKKALERADTFRQVEGKHLVPVASAKKAWNLGDETAAGRRTVAALTQFGLFHDEGFGEARKVKLSEMALNILLDKQPQSAERDELIRRAALTPPIHKELWGKWQNELPSDATIETYLVRDRGFSSNGALDVIAEYKNTLAFAKLSQSDNMSAVNNNIQEDDGDLKPKVEVGDLVNVVRSGALVFPKPVRVLKIQDNEGQLWVWTDGAASWTEMETVELVAKNNETGRNPPPPPLDETNRSHHEAKDGWQEERLLDDDGEEIFISYKGKPSSSRYSFIRDYLDFKIQRLKPKAE